MKNRPKNICFFFAGMLLSLGLIYLSSAIQKFYYKYNAFNESEPVFNSGRKNFNSLFENEFLLLKVAPKPENISKSYNADYLLKSLQKNGLNKGIEIIFRDQQYSFGSSSWFDKYIIWWISILNEFQIYFMKNSFDCDNFSDFFMVTYSFINQGLNKGLSSQLACGTIIVEQLEEFADIKNGEGVWHSLNIVWLDESWFVVEPQNGVYIDLGSYPNKNNIKVIIF